MKQLLNTLFVVTTIITISSCSDTDTDMTTSNIAHVSLDYTFSSGTITRADDMYSTIYNKVLTKELAADTYSLTFINLSTNKAYTFSGSWKGNMISLETGRYKVIGTSIADGNYIQDKCSLKFNTEVNITQTDHTIVLQAAYDCFLLIFDKAAVKEVTVHYNINASKADTASLFEFNNMIYGFSRGLYNENINVYQYLVITLNDDTREDIQTNGSTVFEIGKYYLYSPLRSNFLLPRMEAGNI